jgi:spectinomycin phosphotransferase
MLEKPQIQDEKIMACVQLEYGLQVARVEFLPLGNDQNSAVYRVVAENGTPYFLKLRSGVFDENAAAVPKFLHDQGIRQIIAPITTKLGQLRANLEPFKLMLYPFIDGQDGYEAALSDQQWQDFGAALKRIHTANIPFEIITTIPRETYSDKWREIVKSFLEWVETDNFTELVAAKLAVFLKIKRQEILELLERTERLAQNLQARVLDLVVCHSDLHAGNLLIVSDWFFIVDWDDQILAPKERDLMFVGGGQMNNWRSPLEEEALFYQGYGATELDAVALSYYRFERIVQDIAAYCEQLFLSGEGGEDREHAYQYLTSNFLPNGVLEITKRADAVNSSKI